MRRFFTAAILLLCCLRMNAQERDSVTLYLFLSDECVITHYYVPTLNELDETFGDDIDMLAVFPNFSSKPKKIDHFYTTYGLTIPHRTDYFKKLTRKLGATITPEAIFYNHTKDKILYQGRIDNSYVKIGKRRRVITSKELKDALSAWLADEDIAVQKTEAVGCFINFMDQTAK